MRKVVNTFDEELEQRIKPSVKPAEKASNHAAALFR